MMNSFEGKTFHKYEPRIKVKRGKHSPVTAMDKCLLSCKSHKDTNRIQKHVKNEKIATEITK